MLSDRMNTDARPLPNRLHLTGWVGTVLSAPEAQPLARFWSDLLGVPLSTDDPEWCTLQLPGSRANLAFQPEEHYPPPEWLAGPGRPHMMLHLDIAVRDAGTRGARLAAFQPQKDVRVLLDPAGHPFCLYFVEE